MGDLAITKCQFGLALECLHHAKDYSGMLLLATSAGDADTLLKLTELSSGEGQNNVAFTANFCLGKYVLCKGNVLIKGSSHHRCFSYLQARGVSGDIDTDW